MKKSDALFVTNNPLVAKEWRGSVACLSNAGWDHTQVLRQAREQIKRGYVLLSHPQCGNLRPNQTPFRSLLLARGAPDDCGSCLLIEQALAACAKAGPAAHLPPDIRADCAELDFSLMQSMWQRTPFATL